MASFQGAPVLYDRIEVLQNGNDANGKTVLTFSSEVNAAPGYPFPPINSRDWRKGNLLTETKYAKREGTLIAVSKTVNTYATVYPYVSNTTTRKHSIGQVIGRNIFDYRGVQGALIEYDNTDFEENSFSNRPEFYHLTSSIQELDSIMVTKSYQYDSNSGYLDESTVSDSKGLVLKTVNSYPLDVSNTTLVNANRIASPVQVETYSGTNKLSTQKTIFGTHNTYFLPSTIQTSKGTGPLEDRLTYHSYYANGNIKEVSKKDGTHVVYIWGYNQTLPVAKIENISFSSIPTTIYNNILSTSNNDVDTATEKLLRDELETLRNHTNLSGAMVTTFTYDPLVGITSMTDPRGNVIYYEYDSFNRLKVVKNKDGHIVSENQYNYKN